MDTVALHTYRPDSVPEGRSFLLENVVHHHAAYYGEHWGFDARFKAQVLREFTEFLETLSPDRDGCWWVRSGDGFGGVVAVDGSRSGVGQARVRWFIVPESCQGKGVGGRLFERAMVFCRERGFSQVYLWTFAGLGAARSLYERNGFVLTEEAVGDGWGPEITEQKFVLELTRTP
ncbi:GNAT family N-acetyltransferase [Pseudodesulfovibrio sediminis]|uniref:N-acetyltransferase domain-containing protein n=1 Tax=Pseudodesulfovibrio sediminis TaxID=2810563 RepID=A0ABM7P722_9BACT|nr:GNAT family N-acetyltransferase [Pseudodesulfovibrio sediminis]BCS89303.1 hypothetical protein PSDVSF_25450 [Pseudodesulfovibrio sediminis]